MKYALTLMLLVASGLVAAPLAHAQTMGTVAGKAVADLDGLPLKDVRVALAPVARGKTVSRKTRGDGTFSFEAVVEGAYRLTASLPGFVEFEQDVVVTANETLFLQTRLAIGRLSERVTMTAGHRAEPLEKRTYTQHADVDRRTRTRERILGPVTMRRVYPPYTTDDYKRGLHGEVHVVGVIDATGAVTRLRVVSAAHDELAALTVEALGQWQYEPARLSGVAIPATGVTFLFSYGS